MKFSSSLTVAVFLFSFIGSGFSCKENLQNLPVDALYYYPSKNIYYDSLRAIYYYSLDSAKTWDSMPFKSTDYGKVLGAKIPLKSTGDDVWKANNSHRKEYNGVLLNIINKHTISLSRSDSINKLKPAVVTKTKPVIIEKEAPPKKGIKKFFNKLFGKKKKPPEEKQQKAVE